MGQPASSECQCCSQEGAGAGKESISAPHFQADVTTSRDPLAPQPPGDPVATERKRGDSPSRKAADAINKVRGALQKAKVLKAHPPPEPQTSPPVEDDGHKQEFADVVAAAKQRQDLLYEGARRGDMKTLRKALGMGADVRGGNLRGVTALMMAAGAATTGDRRPQECVQLLLQVAADVAQTDKNGWPALLHAARNGGLEAARLLVEHKAAPSHEDPKGASAMLLAAMEGCTDMVLWLAKLGVRVDHSRDADGLGVLHHAAALGNRDLVRWVLAHVGGVRDKARDGSTPLALAVRAGQVKVVDMLLKANSSVNSKTKQGTTILMNAVEAGSLTVVQALLDRRADVLCANEQGVTAMMFAERSPVGGLKAVIKQEEQRAAKEKQREDPANAEPESPGVP
mmetsp:Transcript_56603/g.130070  ORF Transcript_56603/g.130070 Transcript_56603/m.130070 type:complete len:398 (-) Transcript_56603:72-1265(-)